RALQVGPHDVERHHQIPSGRKNRALLVLMLDDDLILTRDAPDERPYQKPDKPRGGPVTLSVQHPEKMGGTVALGRAAQGYPDGAAGRIAVFDLRDAQSGEMSPLARPAGFEQLVEQARLGLLSLIVHLKAIARRSQSYPHFPATLAAAYQARMHGMGVQRVEEVFLDVECRCLPARLPQEAPSGRVERTNALR